MLYDLKIKQNNNDLDVTIMRQFGRDFWHYDLRLTLSKCFNCNLFIRKLSLFTFVNSLLELSSIAIIFKI